MPPGADGDEESSQPDPPQTRFLNISFMACGENLKESSTAQIFSWQVKSFEALKWSQNKLHDLGMNTMCCQRHQFTALKARFSGQLFLVPTAGLRSRQNAKGWMERMQRVEWDTSMGCFCGHACSSPWTSRNGRHSLVRNVGCSVLVGPVLLAPFTKLKPHCREDGGERESLGHNLGQELQ